MKKLVVLFCLLALGLFMGEAFALNASQMQGGNPDRWYIEVEYNQGALTTPGSSSVGHGDLLEWDIDADTGETLGYTVHKVDSADCLNFAGAVPSYDDYAHNLDGKGSAVKDGDVFLMQIYGYHSAIACDGNVVAVTGTSGIEPVATGSMGTGVGYGFAFKDDTADTTNSNSGFSAKVFLMPGMKGTN